MLLSTDTTISCLREEQLATQLTAARRLPNTSLRLRSAPLHSCKNVTDWQLKACQLMAASALKNWR